MSISSIIPPASPAASAFATPAQTSTAAIADHQRGGPQQYWLMHNRADLQMADVTCSPFVRGVDPPPPPPPPLLYPADLHLLGGSLLPAMSTRRLGQMLFSLHLPACLPSGLPVKCRGFHKRVSHCAASGSPTWLLVLARDTNLVACGCQTHQPCLLLATSRPSPTNVPPDCSG